MNRRLIISAEPSDAETRARVVSSLGTIEILRSSGVTYRVQAPSMSHRVEVEGEPGRFSDHDIEAIARAVTGLVDATECILTFHAIPGNDWADGAICTLHPKNEGDQKVVRAFLWELFGET